MSHTGVDVIDFVLITFYPVIGLFIIEMISRAIKIPTWPKLTSQGILSVGFGVAYLVILTTPHWFTSIVLFALGGALFFQARRSKIHPNKSMY